MIKKTIFAYLTFLLILVFSSQTFSQVVQSSERPRRMNVYLLKALVDMTDSHLMLKVKGGQLYALNSKRQAIFPYGYRAPKEEVFFAFHKRDLVKLIIKRLIKLRRRQNSGGEVDPNVLLSAQLSVDCPPFCPSSNDN